MTAKPPRLIDLFGPDKPESAPADTVRRSRRHKPLITHDGTMIVQGESYPIAGAPLALDERPRPSLAAVTFDGAVQHHDD